MSEDNKAPAIVHAPRPPIVAGATVAAIIPTTFEEAFRLGNAFHTAGMAPKGLNSAEACTGVIIAGMELGLTPYVSLQSFANINGRTSLWGDAIPALLWSHGFKLKEWFENSDPAYPDNMVAKCIVTRPDGEQIEREFSVADGKEAKLFDMKDGPWKTAKKRMLQMRARAFSARDGASDVLKGFPIYEEAVDFEDISDAPRSTVRQKKDLKAKLTPKDEPAPEVETTLETNDNGDVIDTTTGEVIEETNPQGASDAPTVEEGNDTPASATDASDTSPAPEVSGQEEGQDLAWWQKTDITDGHAKVGEVYRLASDEAGADGKVPTYCDGAAFSSAGEKGSIALNVYRGHSPEVDAEAQDPEGGGGDHVDETATEQAPATSSAPRGGMLGEMDACDSWLTIKAIWIANLKTPEWQSGAPEDQEIVKAQVRAIVERIGDPVSASEDPTYFTIWLAGEDTAEGADLIEATLATLEKSAKWGKLNAQQQERVTGQAEAKVQALRGEG